MGPAGKMDIELSRWGRPQDKNAQFVVKPYIVAANTIRFMVPAGASTHWMDWQPGQVTFRAARGSSPEAGRATVAEHVFRSGVPSPGTEGISLNLYAFGDTDHPLKHETEVVVEKFEFLP
jgi:hypothetical protein